MTTRDGVPLDEEWRAKIDLLLPVVETLDDGTVFIREVAVKAGEVFTPTPGMNMRALAASVLASKVKKREPAIEKEEGED